MTFRSRGACLAGMIVVVAAVVGGCGTAPKGPDKFQMTFAESATQQYGVPGCSPSGDVYCRAWTPSDRTFAGSLALSGGDAVLMADGSWIGSSAGVEGAAKVTLARGPMCGSFVLDLGGNPDSIGGTWTEVFDCHGRTATGTVIGRRQ